MKTYKLIYILLFAVLMGCDKSEKKDDPVVENYIIPVIFHVMYDDPSNENQYINRGRMSEIVAEGNEFFKNNGVRLTVRLAETKPDGTPLDEVGVNRIKVENSTINPYKFMGELSLETKALLWNTEAYVNVFVYDFTSIHVAGISHLPYTPKDNALAGLSGVNPGSGHSNLMYPHSISLNNRYIYRSGNSDVYESGNAAKTFIHELSHYFGVFHVFAEEDVFEDGVYQYTTLDVCKDTDFCIDTETYNKYKYDTWVNWYINDKKDSGKEPLLYDLVKRNDCSEFNAQYVSYNIMDYDYSYMNKMSEEQIARMYHVIEYSPLVPVQKNSTRVKTKSIEGPIDMPMRIIE